MLVARAVKALLGVGGGVQQSRALCSATAASAAKSSSGASTKQPAATAAAGCGTSKVTPRGFMPPKPTPPEVTEDIFRFDPAIPIAAAVTPPASWYTCKKFAEAEKQKVFMQNWIAVGRTDQVEAPGDYFSGTYLGEPFMVLRDEEGTLRGFYNVCRHHAAEVVHDCGSKLQKLTCPYHAWEFRLDGRLRKATRLKGIQNFDARKMGLFTIPVDTWGPLIFLNIGAGAAMARGETPEKVVPPSVALAPLMKQMEDAGLGLSRLNFVAQRSYDLDCNWKVVMDNFLDGGYHVQHLHKGLANQLDLSTYTTILKDGYSVQAVGGSSRPPTEDGPDDFVPDENNNNVSPAKDFKDRIGSGAMYTSVYPNLLVNRYGTILDINRVVPISADKCRIIYDYWFENTDDHVFVQRSMVASHQVQEEDTGICNSVQRGLESAAYDVGRYAPNVEQAAHHFHQILAAQLRK